MAKLSVTCPACGQDLKALNEDELVKTFKEHAHHHGMEMSEEQVREKVKSMAAKSEGK